MADSNATDRLAIIRRHLAKDFGMVMKIRSLNHLF